MPELRIVDEMLWARVQARRERSRGRGKKLATGLSRVYNSGQGGPKYAFSGLLRCEWCGSSMVVVGGTKQWRAYGCAGHKDGGPAVCSNRITVPQSLLEARLLEPIKHDLLSPELLADLERRVLQKQRGQARPIDPAPRITELRQQIENLTDAIASGALRTLLPSPLG